jgi:cyclophilin family peptidyl-prolyl cis-trans isomerase
MTASALRKHFFHTLAVGIFAGTLGILGCGQKNQPDPSANAEPDSQSKTTASSATEKTVSGTTVSRATSPGPAQRDRLHKSFAEAVRNADDPPPGDAVRPPDETISKKPVFRFYETVKDTWDTIHFTTPEGKKLDYSARIETSAGAIDIALFPEQSPNHVRNFIALARAGYYDQLFCERIRHESNEMTRQELHMIEAGCPLGTGTTGTGSIGYWLKEEFTPATRMSHDEGVLGACRGEEADSAATRFYITLTKAPFLDGNYTIFGKVVGGLDVLRKIGQTPVIQDDEGNNRPQTPIILQKVTIHAQEREATNK